MDGSKSLNCQEIKGYSHILVVMTDVNLRWNFDTGNFSISDKKFNDCEFKIVKHKEPFSALSLYSYPLHDTSAESRHL